MNKLFFCIISIGFFFTSCVPTKDIVYLQENKKISEKTIDQITLKPYRLHINDILSINVKAIDQKLVTIFNGGNDQQSQSVETLYFNGYTIDDHGNIRLPILGEINVLGFTVDEVRKDIEIKLLADYFKKEAEVFVNVKLGGFKYTISGEIGSTGTKILYQDKVNILEAIANAGDITIVGNRKDVKVIRQLPIGTETLSIDLTDASAIKNPAFYLQPNDYIYVKPLKQKSWGTGKTGIESLGTIITILSLATTTFLLLKN